MTTATLTLTAFLLARIADTEATARRVQAVGSCEPAYDPARVLAECEAKRRIVEAALYVDEHEGGGASMVMDGGYPRYGVLGVLQALATVYSDHPDYRSEWTP